MHPKFKAAKLLGFDGLKWPKDKELIRQICKMTSWPRPHKKNKHWFYRNFIAFCERSDFVPGAEPALAQKQKTRAESKLAREDFYSSRPWRELRYLALKNCGAKCQCCGASAKDGIVLHVDHVKPRYTHPHLSLILENLQVLCEDCNLGKGAWDSTDWRPEGLRHIKDILADAPDDLNILHTVN